MSPNGVRWPSKGEGRSGCYARTVALGQNRYGDGSSPVSVRSAGYSIKHIAPLTWRKWSRRDVEARNRWVHMTSREDRQWFRFRSYQSFLASLDQVNSEQSWTKWTRSSFYHTPKLSKINTCDDALSLIIKRE